MPDGDREIQVVENGAVRFVGEVDRVEIDLQRPAGQIAGIGRVGDLAILLEQIEHALDVGQRLANLAIDDTEKIERDVELDQEGVDQHEVADGHPALDHAVGRAPHHRRDAERDDQLLPEVERGQRCLATGRGIFPLEHLLVVALGLIGLVVEVLDRFVVEQAIDRPSIGGRIVFIQARRISIRQLLTLTVKTM